VPTEVPFIFFCKKGKEKIKKINCPKGKREDKVGGLEIKWNVAWGSESSRPRSARTKDALGG
jgi:hypothetical protein